MEGVKSPLTFGVSTVLPRIEEIHVLGRMTHDEVNVQRLDDMRGDEIIESTLSR